MATVTVTRYPTAADLGVDVFDPRVFARGLPYDAFARMRRESPVCWHEEPSVLDWPRGKGFWAITRWEDVRQVSKNSDSFSSWLGCTQIRDPQPEDLPFWRDMMLNMDPPDHTRLRRIVTTAFAPKVVAAHEEALRRQARDLMDGIAAQGECDFAAAVGAQMPLLTMVRVMGLPLEDRHLLLRWTNRVIGYQDDELADVEPERAKVDPRSRAALTDMFDYAREVREHKRRQPAEDLMSILVHAEVDGERLTDAELDTFFFLFTIAGNDTTHSALPGGLLALVEHPAEKQRLLAEPSLLATAIEEMLRYAPPVVHFRRTATRDVEVAGQQIAAGDKVVVFYPSANRGEGSFERPDSFDVARAPNPHVSFGVGTHLCLGAGLARLQLRVVFEELLWRFPHLELAGDVVRLQSNFINGIKRLPVCLGARSWRSLAS